MLLLLTILAIGVLLGMGLGGDPRNLSDVKIRGWWLIPLALILQFLPLPRDDAGLGSVLPVAVVLISYVGLIALAVVNWRLRGFPLILVGLLLNFVVIGINQGMPVGEGALRKTGNPSLFEGLPTERGGKHHLADDRDVLLPLADVVAFGRPFGVVVSVGDLAIDAGGSMFLGAAILGRPQRERPSRPRTLRQAEMWGTPR